MRSIWSNTFLLLRAFSLGSTLSFESLLFVLIRLLILGNLSGASNGGGRWAYILFHLHVPIHLFHHLHVQAIMAVSLYNIPFFTYKGWKRALKICTLMSTPCLSYLVHPTQPQRAGRVLIRSYKLQHICNANVTSMYPYTLYNPWNQQQKPLKIGRPQKERILFRSHPFSDPSQAVSFREVI